MTRLHRSVLACLLPAVVLAACTAGSAAPSSPGPSSPPTAPPPVASAPPAASAPAGPGGSQDGAVPHPTPPRPPIPAPSPIVVEPVTGLHNVHDVRATSVMLASAGGRLTADLFWWSGPAPCSVLAEVGVDQSGDTFHLTVREGAQQLGVACPALAVYKTTSVDLGPAAPGTYTVWVVGVDQPVTTTVAG